MLLGKITEHTVFEGYTSSEDTEKKILRDAFEKGDAWFNTGDLMKTVDVGFSLGLPHYQFVDRVGDTFRWKSENVSTNEVGEIINGHPQVDFCNVYGVEIPKADGRAGMASLVLADGVEALDVKSFSAYVNEHLPGLRATGVPAYTAGDGHHRHLQDGQGRIAQGRATTWNRSATRSMCSSPAATPTNYSMKSSPPYCAQEKLATEWTGWRIFTHGLK